MPCRRLIVVVFGSLILVSERVRRHEPRALSRVGTAAASGRLRWDRRPRLNVFNWSSYIDPRNVAQFERRVRCSRALRRLREQ